jgi:hypothetical protein
MLLAGGQEAISGGCPSDAAIALAELGYVNTHIQYGRHPRNDFKTTFVMKKITKPCLQEDT